jgi:Ca2+-binding RTX toxin-like protein
VNDTITAGDQTNPAIAATASGRFFVAWDEPVQHPVEGRVFLPSGSALGGQFFVNSTTGNNQYNPSVAGLSNGNFVVTFTDTSVDPSGDIRARIFGQNGNPIGNDFAIAVSNTTRDSQSDVAALADGGFVVTWTRDFTNDDLDVRARIFNADGSPRDSELITDSATGLATYGSQVAGLAGGGFVVTWEQRPKGDFNNTTIWFQLYDKDDHAVGGHHQIGGSSASAMQVAALRDGGFAVAYTDNSPAGATSEIRLRLYDVNGNERPSDPNPVNNDLAGGHNAPSITVMSNGFVVVGWQDGGYEVAQAFDPQGGRVGENIVMAGNTSSAGGELAALSGGIVATAVQSSTSDGSDYSIRSTTTELSRTTTGDDTSETLVGDSLRDLMFGNGGNDTLIGGGGLDQLNGGAGNDTYILATPGATISDASGIDRVVSAFSFNLNPSSTVVGSFEKLTLTGTAASGVGNALANTIVGNTYNNKLLGNAGADTLSGGAGNDSLYGGVGIDKLTGGAGKDSFYFDVPISAANRDVITDFSHVYDTIRLENAFFKGMGSGVLKSQYFYAGTKAHDADDHIIYNKATGALYYDSDGTGAHAQVLFAVISNHATAGLAYNDFVLY